jgi:Fur family ferric uptake transcriptional regulator
MVLKKNNLKATKQRELILDYIYNFGNHFTPEELHHEITKEKTEKIGIATIYRTLSLLEKEQMITSISFGANGKKFEVGGKKHHDHMICDKCGVIIEFFDEEIEKLQEKVALSYNFKTLNHIMQIHGICKECQKDISKKSKR